MTTIARLRPLFRALPLVLLLGVGACRGDGDPPADEAWLAQLESVDLDATRNARGRIDAPGFVHWEERERDVSIAVAPRALAVPGELVATDDIVSRERGWQEQLISAALEIQAIDPADRDAAYAAAVAAHGVGNVGYPVLFPIDDLPPRAWPSAVITPDIAFQVAPAFLDAGADDAEARLRAELAQLGLELVDFDPTLPDVCVARATGADPDAWVTSSRAVRSAGFCGGAAHPDLILPPVVHQEEAAAPDLVIPRSYDDLTAEQWHLGTVPSASRGARVREAWERVRMLDAATSPIVAVIDPDGVDWQHPDLFHARVSPPPKSNGRRLTRFGWDFRPLWDQEKDDAKLDPWHGTACAGLIVAADNGAGVTGVAPRARLLPIRIGSKASATAKAILFAAGKSWPDHKGADVLSLSFGYQVGVTAPAIVREALEWARDEGRGGSGCVVVASLTNQRVDNFSPHWTPLCATPGVLAIGRMTDAELWGQSGFGAGMALLAPSGPAPSTRKYEFPLDGPLLPLLLGERSITTTDVRGPDGRNDGSAYSPADNPKIKDLADGDYTRAFSGTSASTPIVAGVAALVLSMRPQLTGEDVRNLLRITAREVDRDGVNANVTLAKDRLNDAQYRRTRGYGCVDAAAAVEHVLRGSPIEHLDPPILWRFPGPYQVPRDLRAKSLRLVKTSMTSRTETAVAQPDVVFGEGLGPVRLSVVTNAIAEVVRQPQDAVSGAPFSYEITIRNGGDGEVRGLTATVTADSAVLVEAVTDLEGLPLERARVLGRLIELPRIESLRSMQERTYVVRLRRTLEVPGAEIAVTLDEPGRALRTIQGHAGPPRPR